MRATGFEFMESHYRKILEENERLLNALIASQRKRDELRAALERIRSIGKDRSEKTGYRIDDMVDEAEHALSDKGDE